MPPFIAIGGSVWIVEGWDYDTEPPERIVLRRLLAEEWERYRRLRRESDIELFTNFTSGG